MCFSILGSDVGIGNTIGRGSERGHEGWVHSQKISVGAGWPRRVAATVAVVVDHRLAFSVLCTNIYLYFITLAPPQVYIL